MPSPLLLFEQPADRQLAARVISDGALLSLPFANIHVLAARPTSANVLAANALKGRPLDRTGTIVTTPGHLASVFDWRRLPHGLGRAQVLDLMYGLLALGPFAFRGPAADDLPAHLTAEDLGVRTVQLVSPGFECPSNEVFGLAIDQIGSERYLLATSIDAVLARTAGIASMRRTAPHPYRGHMPTSPSVLSFHMLGVADGEPSLILARPGSLPVADIRRAAARVGLGVVLTPADELRVTRDGPGSTPPRPTHLRLLQAR
jgi:hypothetical protein